MKSYFAILITCLITTHSIFAGDTASQDGGQANIDRSIAHIQSIVRLFKQDSKLVNSRWAWWEIDRIDFKALKNDSPSDNNVLVLLTGDEGTRALVVRTEAKGKILPQARILKIGPPKWE